MAPDQRCLDDDTITALLERRLDEVEMHRVDAHLDACGACRALVATLADDVSCARLSTAAEVVEETFADADEIPPEVAARVGTVLDGKWTLEAVLGVGGMAAVYKGRHHIGRLDAIKIIHPELVADREACGRFEREARAVNRLSHRSAVAIRDVDRTDDGSPYMVMEFLDGESLADALKRGLATERVLEIAGEVLDVLADAHALGVIHRDVKPANIFLTREGGVKLLDFGLASLRGVGEQSQYTKAGQTLGTLAYMPPEQLRGDELDHRADIFSMGATMFRALSGRHVHRGESAADTLLRIATEPPPSLADAAPEIPLAVCQVVDRALAFEPDDRYPDAETMREDVRALISGAEPSHAASWEREDPDAEARALVGREVGGYVLERLIARGGMGAVYAASRDGERAALKVILEDVLERSGDARARFRREIRAASRIESAHVVEVRDAGVDDATGLPYYAMELLEGRDLAAWLEDVAPLEPKAVAHIFAQACRGIRAAHGRGIVHRDIKPANIMLTPTGGGELTVKLCDFGLAKNVLGESNDESQSLTQTGGILGTPRYAAPEQATRAKEVDARADVWGLCISMYEALSGRKPWADCTTLGQLIVAICTKELPSLRDVAPWVEPALVDLVGAGLVRERDDRVVTLDDLEKGLAALAGAAPLTPASMRRVSQPVSADDGSEDVTVARSVTTSEGPPHKRGRAGAVVAVLAAAAAGALGWATWPTSSSRADVDTRSAPSAVPSFELAAPPPEEPTASPAASSVAPEPSTAPSIAAKAPPPPPPPPRPTAPRSKPAPKPGGLDFHKTW